MVVVVVIFIGSGTFHLFITVYHYLVTTLTDVHVIAVVAVVVVLVFLLMTQFRIRGVGCR